MMLCSGVFVALLAVIPLYVDAMPPGGGGGAFVVGGPNDLHECDLASAATKLRGSAAEVALERAMAKVAAGAGGDVTAAAPCLSLKDGWWEYELCWNRWIRQYHSENGIVQSEYLLGLGLHAQKDDAVSRRKVLYTDGLHPLSRKMAKAGPLEASGNFRCSKALNARWTQLTRNARAPPGRSEGAVFMQAPRAEQVATSWPQGTPCEAIAMRPRQSHLVLACDMPQVPVGFNVSEQGTCGYVLYVFGQAVCDYLAAAKRQMKTDTLRGPYTAPPSAAPPRSSEDHTRPDADRVTGPTHGRQKQAGDAAPGRPQAAGDAADKKPVDHLSSPTDSGGGGAGSAPQKPVEPEPDVDLAEDDFLFAL